MKFWQPKTVLVGVMGLALSSRASEKPAPKHEDHETKHEPEKKAAPAEAPKPTFVDRARCETLPQKSSDELWDLSECYFKLGDSEKSAALLREITRKTPQDLEAYFTASWLLWSLGNKQGGATEKQKTLEALEELQRARVANPTHWEVDTELGDFYYLRLASMEKAYPEYLKARSHYDGDYARNVPKAELGRKAAIENRIARTAEKLDRTGEAVESSCRALFYDPDDNPAQERIKRLAGSCVRKGVQDPRKSKVADKPTPKKIKKPAKPKTDGPIEAPHH